MPLPCQPNRRPRILQCVSHLALGGAERVTVTLIDALRGDFEFALHAVHHAPPNVVGDSFARQMQSLGVPIYSGTKLSMKNGGMLTGALALAGSMRRFSPDLIHLHTEIPEAALATLLCWRPSLSQLPLVRTIHSTAYWQFWRPLGRWCDRRLARGSIAGVSVSALSAFSQLRSESGAQPTTPKPVVIYNGVHKPPAGTPRIRRDGTSPVRLVFGGRLATEKGADLIPEILAQVPTPPSGAQLVIHGHGRHEKLLHALSHNAPPGWSVILQPTVADFPARLAEFDLLLMPSRSEGLGLLAIEAALAGTPVIATDAPGLREALPPEHPWLAAAGSASHFAATLRSAMQQPERWLEVARRAHDFALQRFSVPTMAEAYRRLYLNALANHPRVHNKESS